MGKMFDLTAGSGGGGTGPSPATTKPLADAGTGAVGTSLAYARADHQHPNSGGGGALPELTEEHVVGYLGGETVYEKVFVGKSGTKIDDWNVVAPAPEGFAKVISLSGTLLRTDNISTAITYFVSTSIFQTLTVMNGNICEVHKGSQHSNTDIYVTIRYTKTTD